MATTFDTIQPLPVIDVPADLAVCCPEILGETISEEDAAVAARIFKALGDPGRVRLLSMIAAATDEGTCVCDLVAPVGLSQPTVSHHLKVLLDAGLLERERRGSWAFYRVRRDALAGIAAVLGG